MMSDDAALPFGAYETPITQRIRERMDARREADPATDFGTISGSDEDARERYISALSYQFANRLTSRLGKTRSAEKRINLINQLATLLDEDDIIDDEELLYSVYKATATGAPPLPDLPLNSAALLTNAPNEANFAHELQRELKTADSVDLLCAFIKNSGISVLHKELIDLKQRGIPLRVITSTYCGATDSEALRRLVEVYGAEVHVGYESKTTRLHAKAWLFRRNSGFDTAFIGSSNLSNSALVDGIEWNVRTSKLLTPAVISKFTATFDTYWNDPHFGPFDPRDDMQLLEDALDSASWSGNGMQVKLSSLEVRPYPYQEAMLEALDAERTVHDRHKNLLVAATGTGKTVVAALDYQRLVRANDNVLPSFLFVAHRKEILEQALRTYREVLKEPDFGELLVGGDTPRQWKHVFASIQSLSGKRLAGLPADHFEVIVIDEFHHAEAASYKRLISHLRPQELLGLTATPERGDGLNVESFFDYRVAYELRLWDALQLQLLTPMHYFGINDDTDLSGIRWSRSSKDYQLSELGDFYIKAGDRRIKFILREIDKRIFDMDAMKALGFCVSVSHAEYMAARFNAFGVPAAAVSGNTSVHDRKTALSHLRDGKIKVIFSVDVFNEGIDIPEANTILLLRPTQSPTIFVQQLGRGLRLSHGKDVCAVFDFIGQQHEQFNFQEKYAALTGKRGKYLIDAVQEEFPQLPPGTSIQLDQVAQDQVLKNIRKVSNSSRRKLKTLISNEKTTDLGKFLRNTGVAVEDIYRSADTSWAVLLREVGLLEPNTADPALEKRLIKRLRSFIHVNDPIRAEAYTRLTDPEGPDYESLSAQDQAFSRMLCLMFWSNVKENVPSSFADGINTLRKCPVIFWELNQLLQYRVNSSRRIPGPVPSSAGHRVLYTHAEYARAELVGAISDEALPSAINLFREGVKYYEEANLDLFLVTLDKNDDSFSSTTSYQDYPITPDRFHWESQSSTTLSSATGQRYIHHQELESEILLAVRLGKLNSIGATAPYTLLGTIDYLAHRGEKPIQLEWKLKRAMPRDLYLQGRAVV